MSRKSQSDGHGFPNVREQTVCAAALAYDARTFDLEHPAMSAQARPAATTASAHAAEASCPFAHQPVHRFPLPRQHPMHPPKEYEDLTREHPVRRITQWN